jgi:hypothetical protein
MGRLGFLVRFHQPRLAAQDGFDGPSHGFIPGAFAVGGAISDAVSTAVFLLSRHCPSPLFDGCRLLD